MLTQAGDSNSYKYQWAVSADPDATKLEWNVGETGVAQKFKQKESTYIHIKPDDSTQYDNLGQCTLTVRAKDLAGNTGVLTIGSDKILWYVDNRAPKATAGETRKVLNGDVGTLYANISFDDSNKISDWEYAWSSDNTNGPTTWTKGGGITEGYEGTAISVTASKDVAADEKFEGYLWVRATDNSNNKNQSKAECIGKYAYDLTATKYALSYSKAVTEKASLKVSQLDAADALVFMIPVQNTENQYSVLRVTADNFVADKNIFEMDGWENWYVSENGGVYTMTGKAAHSISSVINGTYAGDLEVQVLSGKTAGLVGVGGSQWSAGSGGYLFSKSEEINLRLASNNPWRNYSISVTNPTPTDYIRLTTTASTGLGNTKQIWDGTKILYSTLAGCEFDITIDQDRFGWNGDDIDCRKSKLVVTNTTATNETPKEIPLTGFSKNKDDKWSQKIIVSGEYTSGVYTAVLKLVSVTGAVAEIPITGSARTIVVDATEPNENLTLSSILNDRFSLGSFTAYGVEEFYPERECIKEGESVIELPIGAGYFDRSRNEAWAQSSELYKITFTSENEPNRQSLTDAAGNLYSYIGQYYVEAWTEDNPDKKVKFNTESAEQTTITNRNYRVIDGEGWKANGFSILDKDIVNPNFVYLAPDEENKVYFRKVYANGRTTGTQSVFIKPVNKQLIGTMSLDKENKKLVFNPDPSTGDETSIGATVYAFAYQNGQDYTKGEGERIPMDYYDGKWTCDLKENGAIYRIVTLNSYGSIWASKENDEIRQCAPYMAADPTYIDNGDGTYEIKISLYDDYDTIKKDGLMLSVGFNNDYATEPYKLEVTGELFDAFNPYTYIENIKGYSKNGIYQAEVSVSSGGQNDYLTLTIHGVMIKKNSDSIEEQPMQVTVTAVDAYGNRMEKLIDSKTVKYQKPKITGHELTQDGLKLTFSHPVVPTDSWAWQESEQKEVICKREWAGAFPVAANGTYEIEFRDVFGNICTDTLTTDDFTVNGIDWSLDLTFSETELTKDPIFFTAEMPNNANVGAKTAGVLIYDRPTITTLVPEGNYNGYPHKGNSWISFDPNRPWSDDTRMAPSSPRTVKLEKNTALKVFVYNSTWVDNYNNNLIFGQPVYINNIANEAPEAKVYYYHPMIGSDMTYEQLEQYIAKRGGSLKLEGSMQVTYKTARSVTPTNDSGSMFYFTQANYTASHTFSYIDGMGHSGSVTVSLPDGLELVGPDVPYVDTTAPSVKVALSAKINGSYTEMESFIAGETPELIKDKVLSMDIAQGYSLKVNAQDESGYTMTVTEADGVSVMGNMILVDKPSAFTVTVTDRSENRNVTAFSMTADMFEMMDNIPPTAEIDTQSVTMYEKKLLVQLHDTNNKGDYTTKDEGGNDIDSITLVSPSNAVKVGPNKYEYTVKENGKVDFVFRDRAGNRNAGEGSSATISGIDTNPPNLKLTWAPPLNYFDDENEMVIDYSQPTTELINTDATAFVDSDKAMYKLVMKWEGQQITLLEKGIPTENNPYVLAISGEPIVTISATTERIKVVYAEGYGERFDFDAYAANGKHSEIGVMAYISIDKVAPKITAVQENQYRRKDGGDYYSVPYAVKVTLTPDEGVFSDNYGGTEMVDYGNGTIEEEYKIFWDENPLVLTFTENGTYHVRLSDYAGNVTVESVTISGIDRTEPNITLGELSGGGQSASIPVTVDKDCIVSVDGRELPFTAGVEQTVSFSNNGNYTIMATDSAGNKSERVVTVGNIDRIMPSITFTTGTIYVLQNGDADEYNNQLRSGYNVWDNKTAVENLTVNYDASAVRLDTAGMYTVVYTVTDEAGNENQANRFVQVIGEDTTCICIDGVLVMPDSTAVIKPGTHTLTLKNGNEPYSIKARKGIRTSGQMKYLKGSSLSFNENGEFAVRNEGYYTVQVTTQSRKVIRIKLYVEQ